MPGQVAIERCLPARPPRIASENPLFSSVILERAFSLSPLATNSDASSGFFAFRFCFLARGNVGVAPAFATGPRGTTAARGGAPRPEHTRQALQWKPGRRNQARESRQKLHRRHREVRRAVAPRLAKEIRHAAVGKDRPALQASLRSRAVAAQAFQSFAVARAHDDACMHVEPRRFRHPRALARCAKPSLLSRERRWRAMLFAEDLHEHSALIAELASELSEDAFRCDAFAAGMLHDVGRLLLATKMPEEVDGATGMMRRPLPDAKVAPITRHAKVGGYLLGLCAPADRVSGRLRARGTTYRGSRRADDGEA